MALFLPYKPRNTHLGVDTSYSTANERRLVAVSDNVFLGRVLSKTDDVPPSENSPPLPTTEFAVKVERNIKGSLSGTVTVVQGGGCDPRYGHIVLINGDPLLKPGEEALFTTHKEKDSPEGPYYLVTTISRHVTVKTKEQQARVVARFQQATREQISSAHPSRAPNKDRGNDR